MPKGMNAHCKGAGNKNHIFQKWYSSRGGRPRKRASRRAAYHLTSHIVHRRDAHKPVGQRDVGLQGCLQNCMWGSNRIYRRELHREEVNKEEVQLQSVWPGCPVHKVPLLTFNLFSVQPGTPWLNPGNPAMYHWVKTLAQLVRYCCCCNSFILSFLIPLSTAFSFVYRVTRGGNHKHSNSVHHI